MAATTANTGSFTMNGLTAEDMTKIWEIISKHDKSVVFDHHNMQSVAQQNAPSYYNNAVFSWKNLDGLKAVNEITEYLIKAEEKIQGAVQGR